MPARRSTTPAVLSLWALAAAVVALQACGSNGEGPAVFQGTSGNDASALPPCKDGEQGCACPTNGQKVACGEIVTKNGGYVTCSMGTSTCEGGAWSACKGNTIVVKSQHATRLGVGDQFEPLNIPVGPNPDGGPPCTDPCDPNPNCTELTGTAGDVDAAGIYPTAEGGLSLGSGDASTGPCQGLQCYVAQCTGGVTTTITGVVTDPAGNVPLYNATVYIPVDQTGTIPAFTSGVTCSQCAGAVPPDAVASTTTDTTGTFTLTSVPTGSGLIVPIVVQMGKWRREILLSGLTSCTNNVVTTNCTATDKTMCAFRLPQNQHDGYNPADGSYDYADMPQMAMVTGSADPLECILLKAGISESEFSSYMGTNSTPAAHVHMYESPNAPGSHLDPHLGINVAASTLWADTTPTVNAAPHYNYYDVVLDACEGSAINKHSEHPTNNTAGEPYYNLINYTNAGGRAFLTHFSYVWLQYASAYSYVTQAGLNNWSTVATWEHTPLTGTIGTQDPLTAYVITDFTKGAAYESWLLNVGASITADQLILHEARQDLYDPAGKTPATNSSSPAALGTNVQPWLNATDNSVGSNKQYVPHFTFNTPIDAAAANQCGRVVYSDFHVSANALVSGGPVVCTENAQCGFGQTCTGHPGTAGTCSEPCISNADCKDSTYSCVGVTAGQCLPTSCKAGTPTYACPGGLVCDTASHTNCLCTNDNQCPSGKCINTIAQNQCNGLGPCTGNAANGLDPSSNCQLDAPVSCPGTTIYSCSDTTNPAFSCSTGSGTCTGVVTGNALTTCTAVAPTCTTGAPNPLVTSGPAAGTECWCNADSQCASLKCVNNGQTGCTAGDGGTNCTGSGTIAAGTLDSTTGCQIDANVACTASYSCTDAKFSGNCNAGNVNGSCTSAGTGQGACTPAAASCANGEGVVNTVAITYSGGSKAVSTTCLCTADSQCASLHCFNTTQTQCSGLGPCTGAGPAASTDAAGCQIDANVSCTTTYSCTDPSYNANCNGGNVGASCISGLPAAEPTGSFTCSPGVPNASSVPSSCLCSADSQCGGGVCVLTTLFWGQTGANTSCTGVGPCTGVAGKAGTTTDAHQCQFDGEAFTGPTGGGTYTCPDDSSRGGQQLGCDGSHNCNQCSKDSQCKNNTGRCYHDNGHGQWCANGVDAEGCCEDGPLGQPPTATPTSCSIGLCDTDVNGYAGDCECGSNADCGAYGNCTNLEDNHSDWFGCRSRGVPGNSASCTTGLWDGNGIGCTCTADSECGEGSYCLAIYTNTNTCTPGQPGCSCPSGASCTAAAHGYNYNNVDYFQCSYRSNTPVACGAPDTYSCSTGTPNAGDTACVCNSDNHCSNQECASLHSGTTGGTDGCVNACTVSLGVCTPGTPNATDTTCLCTNDNQCSSGHCVPTTVNGTATCTVGTPCTGSGSADSHSCQLTTAETVASAPTESCSNGSSKQASGACWCVNDNECADGVCVWWGSCNGTSYSNSSCSGNPGTLTADGSHCSQGGTTPKCQSSATCSGSQICSGGNCKCGADSDCATGVQCGSVHGIATGLDDRGCVSPTEPVFVPAGAPACSIGTCNSGTNTCWCTNDSQCSTGACVAWTSGANGCTSPNCTGSGAPNANTHCAPSAPTCQAATYVCPETLGGQTPTCNASHNCICGADAECPGSQCGSVHGIATNLDDLGCVRPAALPPITTHANTCPAAGECNGATNECWCTNDNQCPNGACVNQSQPGCTATTCTGSGSPDVNSCSPTKPTCSGTTTYACPVATQGTCNGAQNCICNADTQCGTGGKCVNVGQGGCTSGTCTGAAPANDRGCQDPTQTLPVGCTETIPESCSSGTCNSAGTACLCTADSQCPSGQCIPTTATYNGTANCTSATCTGTGAGDAASCVPSTITNCSNPPPPNGTNSQCGGVNSVELCSVAGDSGAGPGLGQCQKACTTSANCTGGETCVAGFCTGCNTSTNCYDRVYPKACNGASGAVTGQCCGNGSPIPTSTCGTNNALFPEACIQAPLTDQEKALEFMFFDLTSCVTPDTGSATTPVLLTAKSFTLEFTASCPSGTKPRWREFDYQASFPANPTGTYTATYPDDSIDFAAQTGGGLPGVNDAGGAFIPATPLQLGAPATTNTLPPNWVQILLDTAPGGTGLFTTASPSISSQVDLLMTITLTPTADQLSSPTLIGWRAEYDCPPSE